MRRVLWISLAAVFTMTAIHPTGALEKSVEQEFQVSQGKLETFDRTLTLQEKKALKQASAQDSIRLGGALREKYEIRKALKEEAEGLRLMSDLKTCLLNLPVNPSGRENYEAGTARIKREREAEMVARMAIPAFGELQKAYEMVRPAIFHNFLVNVGLKDQGLCWQWARDLSDRLRALNLETFDLLWATARGGTMREHNTVVLVSRGRPLEDGLLLDGWKNSGKPFWIRVPDDKKHPWKLGEYYGGR